MSSLISTSLSELTGRIKNVIRENFSQPAWIVVEIAELKVNATGHCYMEFIEKDALSGKIIARARAIIWSYTFRMLKPYFETTTKHSLSAGLRVLVHVSVEFHELFGFSLVVQDIDPTYTIGEMARERAETIARLEREGVLNINRELELTSVPQRIAIISSATAAGYEDFIHQLETNDYGYSFAMKLFPALMQGEGAASSMLAALDEINKHIHLFDAVAIIRGGGATSELSIFDDYWLACHVAQFPLPVLTGIGHEKDESVVDMVAHTRCKTPTAVAAFLIEKLADFESSLDELGASLTLGVTEILGNEKDKLVQLAHSLPLLTGKSVRLFEKHLTNLQNSTLLTTRKSLSKQEIRLSVQAGRLKSDMSLYMASLRHRIDNFQHNLNYSSQTILKYQRALLEKADDAAKYLSPANVLNKGYSITRINGIHIKNSSQLKPEDELETIFAQGKAISKVSKTES
jgi:exodeoxyribonuclease VII large subunit